VSAKNALKKFYPVIVLTVVVAISVGLLSLTDNLTRNKIKAQQEAKIQAMLSEMFPDMSRYDLENEIYIIYSDEDKVSYAFVAVGKGYGGKINILVGLEDENTLKGISIISQVETPGLGNRITESYFTDQFAGLSADEVERRRDGGQVDTITGATMSSSAVIKAVRAAAMEKIKLIKDGEQEK
jgi:electron transport complex protein RnfG